MKKTLIISSGYETLWQRTNEETCDIIYSFYGCKSRIFALIHKVYIHFKLPFQRIWYNKKLIGLQGTCIVFDASTNYTFLRWLKAKNPNAKLIFYYWNAYENNRINPCKIKEIGYDVWSFDPSDCKKYDMKYNPEFYCFSWYKNLNNKQEKQYDIVFIGRDKNGRMQQVKELISKFPHNIKCKLYFTSCKWYKRFTNANYQRYLKIDEMLELQMQGKAILDFAQEYQSSITLRMFDALCNERKVITNNKAIVKEKIYDRQNIFVVGIDRIEELENFLNTSFKKIDKDALDDRSIIGWSRRFDEY